MVVANLAHAAPPASICRATVANVSDRRPVLLVDVPSNGSANVDDLAVVVADTRPVAVGRVHYTEPDRAGIRLTCVVGELRAGQSVIIIPAGIDATLRTTAGDRIPPYATVDAVMSSTPFGWSDAGTAAGLFVGQGGLVIRNGYATHVARVELADAKTALLEFAPIIPVGPVRPGDRLQFDRDTAGNPQTASVAPTAVATVTGVEPENDAETITLATSEGTTYREDDRLDVLRNGAPVAFAVVNAVEGRRITARTEPSLSRDGCQIGDMVRRRPPADATDVDRRGWAFLVDRDYALVSLGNGDGVSRGDQLYAAAHDGRPLTLRVQSVYPDHCGAAIETEGDASPALDTWSSVYNRPGRAVTGAIIGRFEQHGPVDWLATATLNDSAAAPPTPGTILTCDGSPPAAVLVIAASRAALLCYAPASWRIGPLDGRPIRATDQATQGPEVTTIHRTAETP